MSYVIAWLSKDLHVLQVLKYISYPFSEFCNQFDHPNFLERVETSEKNLQIHTQKLLEAPH